MQRQSNSNFSIPLQSVPCFVVYEIIQDICPYTHEPIDEGRIIFESFVHSEAQRFFKEERKKRPTARLLLHESSIYG